MLSLLFVILSLANLSFTIWVYLKVRNIKYIPLEVAVPYEIQPEEEEPKLPTHEELDQYVNAVMAR